MRTKKGIPLGFFSGRRREDIVFGMQLNTFTFPVLGWRRWPFLVRFQLAGKDEVIARIEIDLY
ncbi:MAG: hypothetical protein JSV96_04255 [Candidatus Aminicenantes bacterium]|nr:MAG: hypothetical protein JSV96_04255 [Candidatus Aminicenantes bacterium]